jgi:hypothetical protein
MTLMVTTSPSLGLTSRADLFFRSAALLRHWAGLNVAKPKAADLKNRSALLEQCGKSSEELSRSGNSEARLLGDCPGEVLPIVSEQPVRPCVHR